MQYQLLFLCLILSLSLQAQSNEQAKLKLIIDADTANEIDDLYAIASALREPSFNLLGITSAQFHTSPLASDSTVVESQTLNEELLDLMQISGVPLPLGSNTPLPYQNIAAPSAASDFIIKQAQQMKVDEKLHLVILGSCTNVASAVLQEPSIVPKISVHYIGFWHFPLFNYYNKKEFNTNNDKAAVEVLLNTEGLDFNVMAATTCRHLVFDKKTVDAKLKGTSAVGDYLVERWDNYERWWTEKDPEKTEWIMWDVAIIEALANPALAKKRTFKTPRENTKRKIEVYTKIDVPAMQQQFWEKLTSGASQNP